MEPIDIRPVLLGEIGGTALVVARGMADNPHHHRDFGSRSADRAAFCNRLYLTVLPHIHSHGIVLVAVRDGAILGGLGALRPDQCRPSAGVQFRLGVNLLARLGPGRALRTLKWLAARKTYDPREPHWHLGPVAVDTVWQGQGIGASLMRDFCRRIAGLPSASPIFLETESARNVRFYERFGFSTVGQRTVLGVPTWTMLRHETTLTANGRSATTANGA